VISNFSVQTPETFFYVGNLRTKKKLLVHNAITPSFVALSRWSKVPFQRLLEFRRLDKIGFDETLQDRSLDRYTVEFLHAVGQHSVVVNMHFEGVTLIEAKIDYKMTKKHERPAR
jgi:hypothetical protein